VRVDLNLNRSVAVRVSFVALAIACYFATLGICASFPTVDQPNTMATLQWLVGVIGVAIAGDTIRPSGQRVSALAPPSSPGGAP
jgi:hypothetical protein